MKNTDIMINDWVYLSDATKYAMRVLSVDEDTCYLDFEGNESDPFDGIYGENGIAPIPLTEELLTINNANYDCRGNFYFDTIALKQIGNLFCYYTLPIRFVHELQHLFRLHGMNDRADFFKLKND